MNLLDLFIKNKFLKLLGFLREELEKNVVNDTIKLNLLHDPEAEILKELSIDTITLSIANESTQTVDLFRNNIIQTHYLQDGIIYFDYPLSKYKPFENNGDFKNVIDFLFILRRKKQNFSSSKPEYYEWLEPKPETPKDGNEILNCVNENDVNLKAQIFEPGKLLFNFICYKYWLELFSSQVDPNDNIYKVDLAAEHLIYLDYTNIEDIKNELENFSCYKEGRPCNHVKSFATIKLKVCQLENCQTYINIRPKIDEFEKNFYSFHKKNDSIDKLFNIEKKYGNTVDVKKLFFKVFDEIIPKKTKHSRIAHKSLAAYLAKETQKVKLNSARQKLKEKAFNYFEQIAGSNANLPELTKFIKNIKFSIPLLYLQYVYSGYQPIHLIWMPLWEENVSDVSPNDPLFVFRKFPLMSLITVRATDKNISNVKDALDLNKINIVIQGIYLNLIRDYYYGHLKEQRNIELHKHATRAAISQVMARNMSHNIGSHVLSNMVTVFSVQTNYSKTPDQYNSKFMFLYE
jgi:hypothetical protein